MIHEIGNYDLTDLLTQKVIKSAKAIIIVAGSGLSADTGISIGDPHLEDKFVNLTYSLRNQETLEFTNADAYRRHYNYSSDRYTIQEYLKKIQNAPIDSSSRERLVDHLHKIIELRNPAPIFALLKSMVGDPPLGYFIITGNVDGYFQRTGFEENAILELNGSIGGLFNVQERQLTDFTYYKNKLKEMDITPLVLAIGIRADDFKLKMCEQDFVKNMTCLKLEFSVDENI